MATTVLALTAQVLLVAASPLADTHYHKFIPLSVESVGTHQLSHGAHECPECLALQTLAVPGSSTLVLRASWAREEIPAPRCNVGHLILRRTATFPRAPPTSLSATL